MILTKLIVESFRQSLQALRSNKLRTFLSLLGIMIGIYSIIVVKSAVDSFQDSIVNGFSELGSDVVYVDKFPWNEDGEMNWWKYQKRPNPDIDDYKAILKKSKLSEAVSYTVFQGGKTIKHKSNNVENTFIMGVTPGFEKIQALEVKDGRFFSAVENASGSDRVVLGNAIATALFEGKPAVGKEVKFMGKTYQVIGVLAEEGESMFNFMDWDEAIVITLSNLRRMIQVKNNNNIGEMLQVKAAKGVDLNDLTGELAGIVRAQRKLSPREENNFSLNEITMLNQMLESIFGVVNTSGFIIGIFALIVGMFSVANIMFVSVKERTSLIGVKKALGAKQYIILTEFLLEAMILCLIGGVIGIILVFFTLKGISAVSPLDLFMSWPNVMLGLVSSIVVGILSGIIPALQASRLDPVVAIRS